MRSADGESRRVVCHCGFVFSRVTTFPARCHCGATHLRNGAVATHSSETVRWPIWAKAIAQLRSDADIGVGDTVHRLVMGDQVETILRILGVKCGCTDRRKWLNKKFAYAELDRESSKRTPTPL